MSSPATACENFLESCGININGKDPWDVQVNPELKDKILCEIMKDKSLAAGRSFMQGLWKCDRVDQLYARLLSANVEAKLFGRLYLLLYAFLSGVKYTFVNPQRKQPFEVAYRHYNIGNELFQKMLGPSMAYSCAYWELDKKKALSLEEAQRNKFELCCRKLKMVEGDQFLDVGCGWGGLLRYAAENYGIIGTGITVSNEQKAYATQLCKGFPIEIKLLDFREMADSGNKFDKIASVGMFEHVGPANYRKFMKIISLCLKPGGRFLLHTIGTPDPRPSIDPWINHYIFPNAVLPSIGSVRSAFKGLLKEWDYHEFGTHYDHTLMAWWHNFCHSWEEIRKTYPEKYDDAFFRMWKYYLQCCAGSFRSARMLLFQLLLGKDIKPCEIEIIR